MARYYQQQRARYPDDAARDRRIAESELRRAAEQREFNERLDRDLAARSPERVARDEAELARLNAARTAEYERQAEWLKSRHVDQMTSQSLGT